jgi:hypothetical protein
LTEWKKAPTKDAVSRKFDEARSQAKCYAQGILAGAELHSYRYAVVVSEQWKPPPANITCNDVTYRHIIIAVDPLPPSRH